MSCADIEIKSSGLWVSRKNIFLSIFANFIFFVKIKNINGTGPTPRAYSAYISLLASRSEKNLFPSLALSSLPGIDQFFSNL